MNGKVRELDTDQVKVRVRVSADHGIFLKCYVSFAYSL